MGKQNITEAFRNAFAGIVYCACHERNMRIHMGSGIFVGCLAWWLQLESYEIMILVLTVASVVIAEMLNTAVEKMVDLLSPGSHPLAKIAKDVAAGAVLIAAMSSLVVGYLLFFRKLWP